MLSSYKGQASSKQAQQIVNNSNHILDINQYSIDELFQLFKIPPKTKLTEKHLIDAKRMMLKSHPDKSNLPPSYFILFKDGYNKLVELYQYTAKYEEPTGQNFHKINASNAEIPLEMSNQQKAALQAHTQNLKTPADINAFVMSAYDELTKGDEPDTGYTDWLRSHNGASEPTRKLSKHELDEYIERERRKQMSTLTNYTGIQDVNLSASCGYQTLADPRQIMDHSSDIFAKGIQYQDLKKAHTESLIHMSENPFQNHAKSFNEIQQQRSVQENDRSFRDYVAVDTKKQQREMEEAQRVAQYNANKQRQTADNTQSYWAKFMTLTNG